MTLHFADLQSQTCLFERYDAADFLDKHNAASTQPKSQIGFSNRFLMVSTQPEGTAEEVAGHEGDPAGASRGGESRSHSPLTAPTRRRPGLTAPTRRLPLPLAPTGSHSPPPRFRLGTRLFRLGTRLARVGTHCGDSPNRLGASGGNSRPRLGHRGGASRRGGRRLAAARRPGRGRLAAARCAAPLPRAPPLPPRSLPTTHQRTTPTR